MAQGTLAETPPVDAHAVAPPPTSGRAERHPNAGPQDVNPRLRTLMPALHPVGVEAVVAKTEPDLPVGAASFNSRGTTTTEGPGAPVTAQMPGVITPFGTRTRPNLKTVVSL